MNSGTRNVLKMQAVLSSRRIRPVETRVTMNERNIPFVNRVKYFYVMFERKTAWRFRIETTEAESFRKFFNVCFLFEYER